MQTAIGQPPNAPARPHRIRPVVNPPERICCNLLHVFNEKYLEDQPDVYTIDGRWFIRNGYTVAELDLDSEMIELDVANFRNDN